MLLKMSIAFCKDQVTQYTATHVYPVGTHGDASVTKDALHWCRGCWYAVHAADKSTQRLELFAVKDGLDGVECCFCITNYLPI